MSIADLLDDWFESPQIKGALAVNGVIGTWAGPHEPGTAYVMAHHSIGDVGDGRLGSWGFPEGGMGAVADAIASSARAIGVTIRTGARGREGHRRPRLRPRHRRRPRRTATRSRPRSSSPRCTRRPRSSTTSAGRTCRPTSSADIEHWKTRSGVVKINLALGELPDFTANPGTNLQEHHTGSVEMAPSMEYIERAFIDAREGRPAAAPVLRRGDPDRVRQDPVARGHPHHVAVHPVGPVRLERRAAPGGAREVRRPGDRHLQRGRAQLQGARSCTATSSAPTRWSTTTA